MAEEEFTNIWGMKVEAWKLMARSVPMSQIGTQFSRVDRTMRSWKTELFGLSPKLVQTLPSEVQEFWEIKTGKELPLASDVSFAAQDELKTHCESIRGLVQRLRNELQFPSSWDSFINDFSGPGVHWQSKEVGSGFLYGWEVADKKGEAPKLIYPLEADEAGKQLYESLISHLKTSNFSHTAESLEKIKTMGGEYLLRCHNLMVRVETDIRGTKVGKNATFPFERGDPGFTRWFPLIICVGAIETARGNPPFVNLSHKEAYREEPIPQFLHKWLRYGDYGIVMVTKEEQTDDYKELHKDLMDRYSEGSKSRTARAIAEVVIKSRDLEKHIATKLEKFSHTVPFPGYCELCREAIRMK